MWMMLQVAFAAPTILGTHVTDGKLGSRLATQQADLVLLYGGEQRGSMEDCGCPNDPRGSLARVEGYTAAVEALGSPTFLLNAGNWLNDPVGSGNSLRADALVQNAHMVDAVKAGSWDVLNVSFRDLPYAGVHGFPEGAVSANARGRSDLPTHRLLQAGDVTVAVTGITHWAKQYLQPDDMELLDPVEALEELLPTLREQADVVVVLAFGMNKRIKEVGELPIDVLIEADGIRNRMDPVAFGNTLWVRSNDQTQFLGELRVTMDTDGLGRCTDRAIDMDADIPSPRPWRKRAKRALADVRKAQERLQTR